MQDAELFELCKSVYEATGWDPEDKYVLHGSELGVRDEIVDSIYNITEMGKEITFPLYTSDYLLEKLHDRIEHLMPQAQGWAVQGDFNYLGVDKKYFYANTPVKCLLKLTLELHKKGLLDAKDN